MSKSAFLWHQTLVLSVKFIDETCYISEIGILQKFYRIIRILLTRTKNNLMFCFFVLVTYVYLFKKSAF